MQLGCFNVYLIENRFPKCFHFMHLNTLNTFTVQVLYGLFNLILG